MPWVKTGSEQSYRDPLLEQGLVFLHQSTPLSMESTRVLAVCLKLQGVSEQIICNTLNISSGSIYRWMKIARTEGWDALRVVHKGPKKTGPISEEIAKELKALLAEDPKEHGFVVWDDTAIQEYLKAHHNISLPLSVCRKLLLQFQAAKEAG